MVRMGRLGAAELMFATAVRPLKGRMKTTAALAAQEMPAPDNRIWMVAGDVRRSLVRKVGCSFTSRTAVEMERRGGLKATTTSVLPGEAECAGAGADATTKTVNRNTL